MLELTQDLDKSPELPNIELNNKKKAFGKRSISVGKYASNATFLRSENLQDVAIDPRKYL
jgi:hypothetical protein